MVIPARDTRKVRIEDPPRPCARAGFASGSVRSQAATVRRPHVIASRKTMMFGRPSTVAQGSEVISIAGRAPMVEVFCPERATGADWHLCWP